MYLLWGLTRSSFFFFDVSCYQLCPPLLWSANLFSISKNFSCHNWCFTFTNFFYMPTPPQLAFHNFYNTSNFSYHLDALISDFILQSFSTNHSEHSHFCSFQSVDILNSHCLAFCSTTDCTYANFVDHAFYSLR